MSSPDRSPAQSRAGSVETLNDGLYRIGRLMEQVEEMDRLLRAIIEECRLVLRCDAASVALYDPQRRDLSFAIASGGDEQGIQQWRIPLGQGIVGVVAETRQPTLCNDPQTDPRWFGHVARIAGFVTKNLAAAPMARRGELIGVLEVLNRPAPEGFAEKDLTVLQILADQAAVALETHRLIKAKQESERLATFAVALADIGHSTKNILVRLELPISLIDKALETQNWEMLRKVWPPMKRAAAEIDHLVKDMLNYSKPRQPRIEMTDVSRLAAQAIEICRADADSKNIELILEESGEDLFWPLDPNALRPALNNLVGNAIEAIAEHGGSTITVSITTNNQPEELRVAVRDDGPGIPRDIQRRVFDPFFSTKASKGTGLGLANVKKGVEEHGGSVALVSEPGAGAEFTLIFPKPNASALAG